MIASCQGYAARMRINRFILFLTALSLIAAACSGSSGDTTTTSTGESTTTTVGSSSTSSSSSPSTTSTTVAETTTTTVAETTTTTEAVDDRVRSPLNGLPVDDPALIERRVIAIKIDNHVNARPQSGLAEADAVVEILVEGGITRFLALFHHSDADYVGPIRSGRPTDPSIIRTVNGVFAYSGAQAWINNYISRRKVPLIGEGPGMFRISSRSAPHNLYGSTSDLRDVADSRGFSDEFGSRLYQINKWTPQDETASEITLTWSGGNVVRWEWHPEDGHYHRFLGSNPHQWITRDGVRGNVSAETLVVLAGRPYTASPPQSERGSSVPATETVGSGRAWVFHQGEVMVGTWDREAITDRFRIRNAAGEEVGAPPGTQWISIFPNTQTVSWDS